MVKQSSDDVSKVGITFARIILYTLITTVPVSITLFAISQKADVALALPNSSWWPLGLNNWWEYKQMDVGIGIPPVAANDEGGCLGNQPPAGLNYATDRTTWWVLPPDLTYRGDLSKTVIMFKTHPCLYNFRGRHYNIRWSMRHEGDLGIIEAPAPLSEKWVTQSGVVRYKVSGQYLQNQSDFSMRLPFAKTSVDPYYKDTQFGATGAVRRQPLSATNIPYALYPPSVAESLSLNFSADAPNYYVLDATINPTPTPSTSWHQLQSYTYQNANGSSNWGWREKFRFIPASQALGWGNLPSNIRSIITPSALVLEATYAEELSTENHYCERWYYAKVRIPILVPFKSRIFY